MSAPNYFLDSHDGSLGSNSWLKYLQPHVYVWSAAELLCLTSVFRLDVEMSSQKRC